MSRNIKPEYLRKLASIETNGFKVDLANYLYNPAHGYEYPTLIKRIGGDDKEEQYQTLKYFKYYDGRGEYSIETYSRLNNGETWQIIHNRKESVIEESNRYSLPRLQQLAVNY